MNNPRPVPLPNSFVVKNGLKILLMLLSSMPDPVSLNLITILLSSMFALILSSPPSSIASPALEIKFKIICSILSELRLSSCLMLLSMKTLMFSLLSISLCISRILLIISGKLTDSFLLPVSLEKLNILSIMEPARFTPESIKSSDLLIVSSIFSLRRKR